ncbi:MAG: CRISPR-associated endonuclease Cas1 [Methanocalculus sp. MSAO_Arc1]|uniref:CRISPR-associated endonuclease Cas1 n=1 Tax=Methanocalculus TaxID=71151 RepID=UPI000FF1372E|nr:MULTISPECIES: CRISPR-associated endonuclease Cas1 [unclassified Methanocalculus]MCP1663222.1 CRISPR-associated endonuclease Cas1 [Methanocalculus sp. AMF5]RQD80695.1 MAG: CRISPR-associated endonuclease Cas1 [Methanocalculus sp. MSAO_Arc1]
MVSLNVPWLAIWGYGAHIKSTPGLLYVQKRSQQSNYPIEEIRHLLLVGGHTIQTATINRLLEKGSSISFFDAHGTPLGTLRPFGTQNNEERWCLQTSTPPHRYIVEIVRASMKSRLLRLEELDQSFDSGLFYQGELDVMRQAQNEVEYLVRIEEIRRLHTLVTDMYYEILSRTTPSELNYRRRTHRPHFDPINAMLSFGYALLFGNACVALIGAHLNPDHGLLNQGAGGLVYDIIEPLKQSMVDSVVFDIATTHLGPKDYELSQTRCVLSDQIISHMLERLYTTIDQRIIDQNVYAYLQSLEKGTGFSFIY